jgi:hypothetical protein
MRIGANYNATAFFDGKLCELLVCNAALSAAQRTGIRAYLAARWGVTV